MDVIWWPGAAHGSVKRNVAAGHLLRIRDGMGSGVDAIASDRLKPVRWRAGSLEYLPPGADHTHSTDLASDWVCVEVSESEWEELVDLVGVRPTAPVSCETGRTIPKADRVLREFRRRGLAKPTDEGLSLAFASELMRQVAQSRVPLRCGGLSERALRTVLEHVEANLSESIGVDDLARVAGLSRFYFIAAFERSTGQTPHQYVMSRRLARARDMLRRSDVSITTIAADCGFSSHAHLCGLFAERYRCTPGQFRGCEEDFIVHFGSTGRPKPARR